MIALFGGSFDPVHLGHLRIAEDIREHFSLKKIIFLPAYLSPLKTSHTASPQDRLNMLEVAIKDNPYFEISKYEIEKQDVSYTVDTALYYKKILGYNPAFIVGTDAFFSLERWKSPEILLENLNFIVAVRGEDSIENLNKFVKDLGKKLLFNNIIDFNKSAVYAYNVRKIDISSTEIRYRVKNNLSIKYLVPSEIENYIIKKNLYRGT